MLKDQSSETLVRVGRQIRRMRQGAGMTQAELAKKLRVSKEIISRIENGQQDILLDMLLKISRIFCRRLKFRLISKR